MTSLATSLEVSRHVATKTTSVYPTAFATCKDPMARRLHEGAVQIRIGVVFVMLLSRVVCSCTFLMGLFLN